MTAQSLTSPAAEIRRLREERDQLLHQVGALLRALPDPLTEIECRRCLCRDAAQAERGRSWSEGYVAAIEEIKRMEHAIVRPVRLAGRRVAPGGAAWLAAVERNDGTEYGGQGLPRAQVPAEVIERAGKVATR
jgi:hypothetical protein